MQLRRFAVLLVTTALGACGAVQPGVETAASAAVRCAAGYVRVGNRCVRPAPTPTPTPTPAPVPPAVSAVNTETTENAGSVKVTLTRAGDLTQPSSLTYQTSAGTARPGVNYTETTGTASFAAGTSSTSFNVPVLDDGVVTGDLTFNVGLHNLVGATAGTNGTVTIHNVDQPPPQTVTCPDRTVIPADQTCPLPPPVPPGGFTPDPAASPSRPAFAASDVISGLPDIPSEFDQAQGLEPAMTVAGSAKPDVLGAFRFICGPGQVLADDPIRFPGQPGKSELHQFYGNTLANAFSTFASMRRAGGSTCQFWGDPAKALNRSSYWGPAMLDGKGNVVRPDFVAIYYKRRPVGDPVVSDPANPQFMGYAVPFANGLRYIFGWDPTGLNSAPTGEGYFNCQGPTARPGHYMTITEAAANCPAGQGNQLGSIIEAPNCWDGKNLDSPDHRGHVGYPAYGTWGYLKCDPAHPFVIPTFTIAEWYSVAAGDDPMLWSLSSDAMAPGKPKGFTLHADWYGAWDNRTVAEWIDNCIDKLLNCSAGSLGSGRELRGAATPNDFYNGVLTPRWTASPHLVPVPASSPMPM